MKSFLYAINGFRYALRTQWNMRFHLCVAIVVVFAACYFNLDRVEWCIVSLCIGLVFSAELINTAIEYTVDLLSPEWKDKAGRAKDIAAAGVLAAACIAAVTGCIIFIPKIIFLFR
jgi:diacylglycerol kinase